MVSFKVALLRGIHVDHAAFRWMLMEAAAGRLKPNGAFPNGQTVTQHLFSQAVADNMQVIRAFGHGATPNFILQTGPGESLAPFRNQQYDV